MPLHMLKLCVGVESIDDLAGHIAMRAQIAQRSGQAFEQRHPTRMIPKRAEEIIDGGSLYWVIKGQVQVRQKVLAIRPFTDGEGIKRCHLVLEPILAPTVWQPKRPFQGWRYLKPDDAPADLDGDRSAEAGLPADLRRELTDLGLL